MPNTDGDSDELASWRPARRWSLGAECLSQMLHAIENNHGVTSAQVHLARGQRNWTFDVAVSLLFLPLYLLGGDRGKPVVVAPSFNSRPIRWIGRYGYGFRGSRLSDCSAFGGGSVGGNSGWKRSHD